jgi:simple sugar transport system permease protein
LRPLIFGIGGAVGLVLLLCGVLALFRVPPVGGLQLLLEGAFGGAAGWSRTLVKTCPLLLTGLGALVAWRAGMYNIGGEGQLLIGALLGATMYRWVTVLSGLGGAPATAAILAASLVGGAGWALVAGWLYVRRGVEVVISTILLNFIAIQLVGWAVEGPIREQKGQVPLSDLVREDVMLFRFNRQLDAHLGVAIALCAAALVYVFLYRTKGGFLLRLVGENPRVARSNRISSQRVQAGAMALSGALCGLAGGVEYLGIAGQLGSGFSQSWGFLGIPVALLGGLHPLFTVASAGLFGALFAGSENLARFTPAGTTIIYVVQAAAVLGFVALRVWLSRSTEAAEESD